ncbi:MAG: hypothetical protein J0G30_01060 [Actinomycetales bacterium]|nr:hypothetical protein [Actinomycetales bacterium]
MFDFAICCFLDRVALGAEFDAEELPLHVTLLGPARTEAELGDIEGAVEFALADFGSLRATGGDDELLEGGGAPFEVTLLDDAEDFVRVHRELIAALRELGVELADPASAGRRYRPHVAVTTEERIERGEDLEVRAVAILDLAPEGDASRARVAAQLPLI